MAASFHYLPRDIDDLTLWDVNGLMEYLADHPPAHVILAAVHMKKQRPSRKRTPNQLDELRREVMQIGGNFVKGPLPAIYRDK